MADKKEYIERGALLNFLNVIYEECRLNNDGATSDLVFDVIRHVEDLPAADVVSKGVYEQVQWERDMAMQQLEEHGIPFCGKADDVVEVVRCKDCGWSRMVNVNGKPEYYCQCWNPGNVIHVCALGFCVWGERKEQT